MDDRLAAVLALRRWLDHAVGDSRIEHRKAFWIALDVLEMALPVKLSRWRWARQFIETTCKATPERATILAALEAPPLMVMEENEE